MLSFKTSFIDACFIVSLSLSVVSSPAYALTCAPDDPEKILNGHEVVFVAFVRDGTFVDGEDADECGHVEGNPEVVEQLKGDAYSVTKVWMQYFNCNHRVLMGAPDWYPIGRYVLIATNEETAQIGPCTMEWLDYEPSCLVDDMRRILDIAPLDQAFRDSCIEREQAKTAEREEIERRVEERQREAQH